MLTATTPRIIETTHARIRMIAALKGANSPQDIMNGLQADITPMMVTYTTEMKNIHQHSRTLETIITISSLTLKTTF